LTPVLELRDFKVKYGNFEAIKDLSLSLSGGESIGLFGRNGAGKTSALKGILGLVETEGKVLFKGERLANLAAHERVARGIGYLPQEIKVFNQLTVEENLRLVTDRRELGSVEKKVLNLFPCLKGRFSQKAGQLSGGEQAMVAIARMLVPEPDLLLLDEPTEGLMPEVEESLFRVLEDNLDRSRSVLIADQNLNLLRKVSSRIYRLDQGCVDKVV